MPKTNTAPAARRPEQWSTNPTHPLVRWRQGAKLSQAQFVELLAKHGAEIDATVLSRIENGLIKSVRLDLLAAISKATKGAVTADAMASAAS